VQEHESRSRDGGDESWNTRVKEVAEGGFSIAWGEKTSAKRDSKVKERVSKFAEGDEYCS
jgi:hypothetical protein